MQRLVPPFRELSVKLTGGYFVFVAAMVIGTPLVCFANHPP